MNLDAFAKNPADPIHFRGTPKSAGDRIFLIKSKNGGLGRQATPLEPLEPMITKQCLIKYSSARGRGG